MKHGIYETHKLVQRVTSCMYNFLLIKCNCPTYSENATVAISTILGRKVITPTLQGRNPGFKLYPSEKPTNNLNWKDYLHLTKSSMADYRDPTNVLPNTSAKLSTPVKLTFMSCQPKSSFNKHISKDILQILPPPIFPNTTPPLIMQIRPIGKNFSWK